MKQGAEHWMVVNGRYGNPKYFCGFY